MLAENLKKKREELKMTQTEVAEKVGVTRVAYGYFENGLKVPSLPTMMAIAKVFETTVDELVK